MNFGICILIFLKIFCSSIQAIIDDKSAIQDGEEKLAALTAGDRTPWAKARNEYFCKGVNRVSLSTIENAVFVVALDDCDYNYDPVRTHWFISTRASSMLYFS